MDLYLSPKFPLNKTEPLDSLTVWGFPFIRKPDYMSHPESMNVVYGLFIYVYVHIGVCIFFS